jgi:hypothetical protein
MAHSRITQRRRLPPSTTWSNGWSQCAGATGRNQSESLVAMDRIGHEAYRIERGHPVPVHNPAALDAIDRSRWSSWVRNGSRHQPEKPVAMDWSA